MRRRIVLGGGLILIATTAAVLTRPFSTGQAPEANPVKHASYEAPAKLTAAAVPTSESLRRFHASARSGAEWLMRIENPANGRFHPGWIPALNVPVDQDSYLNQAAAAYALACAAKYYGDERYLMRARHAILSLLAETQTDPADPSCRYTSLPPLMVNRLAAAGLLLMTIHELHAPAEELLKQGEELCNFIRKQQQADGSLPSGEADAEAATIHAGWALDGLMRSQRNRPAAWKLEVVSRAAPFYRRQWQGNPSPALAALTPALAEAYALTPEKAYAEFAFEMSDWLCDMQYGPDTGQTKWIGGFKGVRDGKAVLTPPTIESARFLEAIAQACLLTRRLSDKDRYVRYRRALDLGSQFVLGLQYTEGNTMHFSPGYRPALIGGYHLSTQNGMLRLDYQQQAMAALFGRLTCVGDQ